MRPFVTNLSKVWYTEKHNTAGLAYEVAVSILGGDICWVNGPFPAGAYNDWKIFNEFGLKSNLEPGERVETDDGYLGGEPEFTKTKSSPFVNAAADEMRNRVRARHENVNERLKEWKVLCTPYRHGRTGGRSLSSHQMVFFCSCCDNSDLN